MGMRKEYRPFDAELAKKGAPYGCREESMVAEILKYGNEFVFGIYNHKDDKEWDAGKWVIGNGMLHSCSVTVYDLVMLPIATCQSKPVYVGDTLYDANGDRFEVEVGHTASMLEGCSWESPVKKVRTRMSNEELRVLANTSLEEAEFYNRYVFYADKIIARAIADGDVVSKETLKEIVKFVHNLDVAGPDVAWVHVEAAYFGD